MRFWRGWLAGKLFGTAENTAPDGDHGPGERALGQAHAVRRETPERADQ